MSAEVDPNRFFEDLGDGSAFEVVLRGHLWVEHELLRSLASALPHPDRVDLDRLPFGLKVGLVAAHGLMRADEVPGYRRLNSLRNRLAHTVAAHLTDQDETDLINALGSRHSAHVQAVVRLLGSDLANHRLRFGITAMCITLQEDRRMHEEAQARLRESAERLRDAAGGMGPYSALPGQHGGVTSTRGRPPEPAPGQEP